MDVVYFFYESGRVRIPFYDYDPALFQLFISSGGGRWDNGKHEFIFMKDIIEKVCYWNINIPFVKVYENSIVQAEVFNFFHDFHESGNAENLSKVNKEEIFDFPVSLPPMPEKLSEFWQSKLETELRFRRYSPNTRKIYIHYNRMMCRNLQKTPEEITPDDVKEFISGMERGNGYSTSSMNLAISAVKFFFRNILKKDVIEEKSRQSQDRNLPMVLSKEEIYKIFSVTCNSKHRLLLMLVYSSGLRVSEVVALKREHIDLNRRVIYIKLGKGRKDRFTILSEKCIRFIKEYYEFYNTEKWLFPGQSASRHISIRAAQHIFEKAVKKANIMKDVSIHNFRHSFATHLLESGTDIRYIQNLLGHISIRTTEKYTHIAKRNILNIQSPLDTIL
jgi:site-specific recombinase XerD